MHRTDHSRFRKRHDFVPDFSHAEQRTRIVIGITAAMVSIVAREPKSCDSYRTLLRGHDELVHVTIETHHCREDHASIARA